jgi:hypothetical protein
MTWRRLHLILCLVLLLVSLFRLATGNFLGGLFTLGLAGLFGFIAADEPLRKRIRGLLRLLRWRRDRS